MKHLQVRLEDNEHAAFEKRARLSGLPLQAAGARALLAWLEPQGAGKSDLTDAIDRAISNVVLKLDDSKRILNGVHELIQGDPISSAAENFAGKTRGILGSPSAHPHATGDVGRRAGQPRGRRTPRVG